MTNKKLVLAGIAMFAIVVGTAVAMSPVMAKTDKVLINHVDEEGNTVQICVSESARETHVPGHPLDTIADEDC